MARSGDVSSDEEIVDPKLEARRQSLVKARARAKEIRDELKSKQAAVAPVTTKRNTKPVPKKSMPDSDSDDDYTTDEEHETPTEKPAKQTGVRTSPPEPEIRTPPEPTPIVPDRPKTRIEKRDGLVYLVT